MMFFDNAAARRRLLVSKSLYSLASLFHWRETLACRRSRQVPAVPKAEAGRLAG
jgi:hypothetical protein